MDALVVNTLRRIRQVIGDSVNSYESNNVIHENELRMARLNLDRILSHISSTTYRTLSEAIRELLSLGSIGYDEGVYSAPRINNPGRGRPMIRVTEGQLKFFYDLGYTDKAMANNLSCSISLIHKKLRQFNLPLKARYTEISDEDLENKIVKIREEHPNAGQVMMDSYLRAEKINVQRQKIRQILSSIDPVGTAGRWSKSIKRRVYTVSTPNSLWHMDAHLKLSRWGFVIHGCIDGYSRTIIYLSCETSIQPEPVLKAFSSAVKVFGIPSRVRSDHGYENILVAVLMNLIRGLNRGSHITGKSTHNQRIERLWVDVVKEVVDSVRSEIYCLEDEGSLDVENPVHMFCIQLVYKSIINTRLLTFQDAWNLHKIRTARNKRPLTLWLDGVLSKYNTNNVAIMGIFDNIDVDLLQLVSEALETLGVDTNIVNDDNLECKPSRFQAILDLTDHQRRNLENIILEVKPAKQKYIECVNYLLLE